MAKMFSGLNTHGTVDLTILDDDEESMRQTCVLGLKHYLRDAKMVHSKCMMLNLNSTTLWGGRSRIMLNIYMVLILHR